MRVTVKVLGIYKTNVTKRYLETNCLYIGTKPINEGHLTPGDEVLVKMSANEDFEASGRLHSNGVVTGMAGLFSELRSQVGDEIRFTILETDHGRFVKIDTEPRPIDGQETSGDGSSGDDISPPTSVLQRQNARHVFIEPFSPHSPDWRPETETDVYMAFGVLQEYTDYRYCCGASQNVLDRLNYRTDTKPDSILISRITGEYLIVEFKKASSSFKANHKPEDVDVLVVWDHDETDETKLPEQVLPLRDVARLVSSDEDEI